jgi:hypothetical protein
MTSRERMLAAIGCEEVDYTPCSFMLFYTLYDTCRTNREFVEKQVEMGLDAFVHVGQLNHELHRYGALDPRAAWKEWVEDADGSTVFCRRIDTPAGSLTSRVRRRGGWPTRDDFPLMKDWIVPRMEEPLVKPEEDLEKVRFLFGPIADAHVRTLREEAAAASSLARTHGLLQVGGWKGSVRPGLQVDPGVMGCDAMSWLSGMEPVMVLALTNPAVIEEYARIIHEWNMRMIGVYLDVTEADLVVRRGWYETTEFWTPAAWRRIIAPTLAREARLVHQAGRRFGYIITSAFLPLVDDIVAAGVDVLIGLDPSEGKGTHLPEIKRRFRAAGRALWGGVSGAITVEMGTGEDTDEAVRSALETLGPGGGFILSPVDNVRENTDAARANSRRFIDAWKRWR